MWKSEKLYHEHDEATMKYLSRRIKTLHFLQLYYLLEKAFFFFVFKRTKSEAEIDT